MAASSRGRRLDLAFDEAARGLEDRERRFAQELSFGAVRLRGRLDHLIAAAVDRPLDRLDPPVLDLLRLGAYQALHMDSVPAWAAVSETVEQARRTGQGRATGLVNAVLRRVVRAGAGPERFPDRDEDVVGWFSTWGSHPRWMIERWLERGSADAVRRLVELDNEVPRLALVPYGVDPSEAAARWEAAGARVTPAGRGSPALFVDGLAPSAALAAVPAWVQDPGAALVGRYAAPPEGVIVADLCAAPGGKALYLARRATYLVAADPSFPRLGALRENVARLGAPVGVVRAEAEHPPVEGIGLVLVDAPCTGTGTLRRHPDARWRLGPDDPARMATVQARLLRGAADAVAVGGILVYSTCTLEPEENEGVVEDFLARRPDFRIEPPNDPELEDVGPDGLLRVLPWVTGFDGAFAARLRRVRGRDG